MKKSKLLLFNKSLFILLLSIFFSSYNFEIYSYNKVTKIKPKSKIITTNTIKDVLKFADKDTLIIFDIDLTLLREALKNKHGKNHFFNSGLYQLVDNFILKYNSKKLISIIKQNNSILSNKQIKSYLREKVNKYMVKIWKEIETKISYIPMEKGIPKLIKQLHQKKIKTMAFTAREWNMHTSTANDLKNANININANTIYNYKILVRPKNSNYGYGYKNGIISLIRGKTFTKKTQKGRVLRNFFKKINLTPKKLIFIDNRMDNVQDVFKYLKYKNIPIIGIWYKYKNFDKNAVLKKEDINIISDYLGQNWWKIK